MADCRNIRVGVGYGVQGLIPARSEEREMMDGDGNIINLSGHGARFDFQLLFPPRCFLPSRLLSGPHASADFLEHPVLLLGDGVREVYEDPSPSDYFDNPEIALSSTLLLGWFFGYEIEATENLHVGAGVVPIEAGGMLLRESLTPVFGIHGEISLGYKNTGIKLVEAFRKIRFSQYPRPIDSTTLSLYHVF